MSISPKEKNKKKFEKVAQSLNFNKKKELSESRNIENGLFLKRDPKKKVSFNTLEVGVFKHQ